MNTNDLNQALDTNDFVGIGNVMLDVLMRPHQEAKPDDDARLLEQRLPELLERKFGLPPTVTYPCPYRDVHLPYECRGDWSHDRYVHLIIMAHVIGATRQNLPPPFDRLVPYFRDTAAKQDALVRRTVEAYGTQPSAPVVSEEQLAKEIASLIELGLPTEAIANQIAGLVTAKRRNGKPLRLPPITKEDF
jgi:hypothetical protein